MQECTSSPVLVHENFSRGVGGTIYVVHEVQIGTVWGLPVQSFDLCIARAIPGLYECSPMHY